MFARGVKFLLLAALPVLCSACSGLLVEACVKDAPKNTLTHGNPRSNMTRWLGRPRETVVFPPSTVPIYSDEQPVPVRTNEVRRMDYYLLSGRVDIPGVNVPEVSNLYGLYFMMTLGLSELIEFPVRLVGLTIRSVQRHRFRAWYDDAGRLVDTKTGSIEPHPVGLASARGLREVEARPLPQAGDFRVEVRSSGTAGSCIVYWMGHAHYAPPFYLPVMDRGKKQVRFIIGNTHRHELKSDTNYTLLIVQCLVTNRGIEKAAFRPLDLRLFGPTNVLAIAEKYAFMRDYLFENHVRLMGSTNAVAIGTGNVPGMKNHLVWKQMIKHAPEKIPAGEGRSYAYVFAVNKDQSRWDLYYDGKLVSELKAK